jgi:hypothetical protein
MKQEWAANRVRVNQPNLRAAASDSVPAATLPNLLCADGDSRGQLSNDISSRGQREQMSKVNHKLWPKSPCAGESRD